MKVMFFSYRKQNHSWPIFVTNLFFSLHYAATIYVSSSFLKTFFSEGTVSLLFVLGALGNILLFLISPTLLKSFGNRKFLFAIITLEILGTIGLALGSSALSVALYFILRGSVAMLIYYSLDIFLEEISENKTTGNMRGEYLTVTNLAVALSPLLIACFTLENSYQALYYISAIILLPSLFLSIFSFHNKPVHSRHSEKKSLPFKAFWKSKSIRNVTLAGFSLELFFVFMVVYTPLYLHQFLHFSWQQIGVMFSIMLLPFVIFEWPVGRLADKKYGEKELMSIGFFLIGIALLLLPFLPVSIFYITAVLFLSRIGASFVEITTESYFFKHVDSRDTGFINIYRLLRPVAMIIGSVLGVVSVYLFSYQASFILLSFVIFYGLTRSLKLKDTL